MSALEEPPPTSSRGSGRRWIRAAAAALMLLCVLLGLRLAFFAVDDPASLWQPHEETGPFGGFVLFVAVPLLGLGALSGAFLRSARPVLFVTWVVALALLSIAAHGAAQPASDCGSVAKPRVGFECGEVLQGQRMAIVTVIGAAIVYAVVFVVAARRRLPPLGRGWIGAAGVSLVVLPMGVLFVATATETNSMLELERVAERIHGQLTDAGLVCTPWITEYLTPEEVNSTCDLPGDIDLLIETYPSPHDMMSKHWFEDACPGYPWVAGDRYAVWPTFADLDVARHYPNGRQVADAETMMTRVAAVLDAQVRECGPLHGH